MRACDRCQGFVPEGLSQCPHCDVFLTWRGKLAASVMVSSTAMTLMACYGAPCVGSDPNTCYGDGGETVGQDEQCDDGLSGAPIETPSFPTVINGTLAAQPGSNVGSCGAVGDEAVYLFTPPAAGDYRFQVGSGVDTVLYIRAFEDMGSCGEQLECDDDTNAQDPEVTVTLGTDPVLIFVDAYSMDSAGDFTLTIDQL